MIQKILTLSTAHVTELDMEILNNEKHSFSFSVGKHEYGSFFCVPEYEWPFKKPLTTLFSKSFIKILNYAVKHNCDYVTLDRDIKIEEGADFDVHNW